MIALSTNQEETLLNYIYLHGWLGTEHKKTINEIRKKLEWDLRDD